VQPVHFGESPKHPHGKNGFALISSVQGRLLTNSPSIHRSRRMVAVLSKMPVGDAAAYFSSGIVFSAPLGIAGVL
jgi:hypothetical protein